MKNIKTKIILSAIVLLSVVGFVGTANAAGPSLYVSQANFTKTPGSTFSVSVGVTESGSKVCAVEGTLVFNNLTCQSITVSGDADIVVQSSPTCSNPHFLIGIQNCTTSDRVLLYTSVKAGVAGTASISPTGVDIIGEGASVGSASTGGSYTINALPVVQPQTPPAQQPKVTKTTTLKTGQTVTTPEATATTPETNNLQASLAGATGSSFLMAIGKWLVSNIIWIIVLILATASAYVVGRISCKINKNKVF